MGGGDRFPFPPPLPALLWRWETWVGNRTSLRNGLLGLILRSSRAGKNSWFLQQENFIMSLWFICLETFLDAVWSVRIAVAYIKKFIYIWHMAGSNHSIKVVLVLLLPLILSLKFVYKLLQEKCFKWWKTNTIDEIRIFLII